MSLIFAGIGVILGAVKDIARAKSEDSGFNVLAWLGERPFQVIARILVTFGILTPGAVELTNSALADVSFTGGPLVVQIIVPLLVGLYGDKVGKTVLEIVEDNSSSVPLLGKLFKWGKKLT